MTKMFLEFPPNETIPEDMDDQLAAGEPLMEKIRTAITSTTCEASELSMWDSYGWYFEVRKGKATVLVMLQASDQWLLQSWLERRLADRLLGRRYNSELEEARAAILKATRVAMSDDSLRWLTEAEFMASAT